MVVDPAPATQELVLVVPAVPTSLSSTRRLLRAWLDGLAWPDADADDILLAVNEALANVVDHAYPPGEPGTASLHVWRTTGPDAAGARIVATVIDQGRWAAYHPDGVAQTLRGRGLAMMRACTAELHVQPSAAGTTVIMVSATVPTGDRPDPRS